jgi:hypothetical protein
VWLRHEPEGDAGAKSRGKPARRRDLLQQSDCSLLLKRFNYRQSPDSHFLTVWYSYGGHESMRRFEDGSKPRVCLLHSGIVGGRPNCPRPCRGS